MRATRLRETAAHGCEHSARKCPGTLFSPEPRPLATANVPKTAKLHAAKIPVWEALGHYTNPR